MFWSNKHFCTIVTRGWFTWKEKTLYKSSYNYTLIINTIIIIIIIIIINSFCAVCTHCCSVRNIDFYFFVNIVNYIVASVVNIMHTRTALHLQDTLLLLLLLLFLLLLSLREFNVTVCSMVDNWSDPLLLEW